MKAFLAVFALTAGFAASALAQDNLSEPAAAPALPVPHVTVNDRAVAFQSSLYPEFYKTNSVRRDMRWVQENDSLLVAFWQAKGDSTLYLLSEYSGLDWDEEGFEIYALRFYPSMGGPEPLALPLGGLRRGMLTVAAPEGCVLEFDLIYQLAQRMLMQTERSADPFVRSLAGHPLMQPTPYRRDNLALLLALVTAQDVIGIDSTFQAYQSAFMVQRTPGRRIFEENLRSQWLLSAERPLVQYLAAEPYTSELVTMTRPPLRTTTSDSPREYVEGLPLKGELGFSVKEGENGRLVVDKIDVTRLAYACGLREGDLIRSVDGKRCRTHKELVENLLDGLDEGGATVAIQREGRYQTVIVQPMALAGEEDAYPYWEDWSDTLGGPADTPPVDTTTADTLSVGPR